MLDFPSMGVPVTSKSKKRVSIRKPERDTTKDTMPPELERLLERARKLEEQATVTEVEKRYELGVVVKQIHEKYDERGIKLAATVLGRPASSLYEYERLPRTWDAKTFRNITKEPNRKGNLLELTHFIALSFVESPVQRNLLYKRALDECIGAKKFRSLVHRGEREPETVREEVAVSDPTNHLCQLLEHADALLGHVAKVDESFHGTTPDNITPGLRGLCFTAMEKIDALQNALEKLHATLSILAAEPQAAE
jgi:hypothetical protein